MRSISLCVSLFLVLMAISQPQVANGLPTGSPPTHLAKRGDDAPPIDAPSECGGPPPVTSGGPDSSPPPPSPPPVTSGGLDSSPPPPFPPPVTSGGLDSSPPPPTPPPFIPGNSTPLPVNAAVNSPSHFTPVPESQPPNLTVSDATSKSPNSHDEPPCEVCAQGHSMPLGLGLGASLGHSPVLSVNAPIGKHGKGELLENY